MSRPYITLIASLPALPPTFEVRRPPISRPRLDQRLSLLEPEDRQVADALEAHLRWSGQPIDRGPAEVRENARALLDRAPNPTLHELVTFRLEVRMLVAALRRRHAGQPRPGREWGGDALVWAIRTRWEQPAFGLEGRHPWLPDLAGRIGDGDPLELERRLLHVTWAHHHRLADRHPFGFEAVLVYLCRWDVVERWTHYDAAAGRPRFDALLTEALGEHRPRFA
jgi:hypothetical protein